MILRSFKISVLSIGVSVVVPLDAPYRKKLSKFWKQSCFPQQSLEKTGKEQEQFRSSSVCCAGGLDIAEVLEWILFSLQGIPRTRVVPVSRHLERACAVLAVLTRSLLLLGACISLALCLKPACVWSNSPGELHKGWALSQDPAQVFTVWIFSAVLLGNSSPRLSVGSGSWALLGTTEQKHTQGDGEGQVLSSAPHLCQCLYSCCITGCEPTPLLGLHRVPVGKISNNQWLNTQLGDKPDGLFCCILMFKRRHYFIAKFILEGQNTCGKLLEPDLYSDVVVQAVFLE